MKEVGFISLNFFRFGISRLHNFIFSFKICSVYFNHYYLILFKNYLTVMFIKFNGSYKPLHKHPSFVFRSIKNLFMTPFYLFN